MRCAGLRLISMTISLRELEAGWPRWHWAQRQGKIGLRPEDFLSPLLGAASSFYSVQEWRGRNPILQRSASRPAATLEEGGVVAGVAFSI